MVNLWGSGDTAVLSSGDLEIRGLNPKTTDLVYPDQTALPRLLKELTEFFAQFPTVKRIFTFGSMASGDWDRWSDIDLLIVAQSGSGQQWQLFNELVRHKPILHHHPFVSMEPSGGFVPGIAFEDESPFHMLDLNFISLAQYHSPQALERFGELRELYSSPEGHLESNAVSSRKLETENPDERRIGAGIHWTKKAIKKTLRRSENSDELAATSTRLKEIMLDYPEDIRTPGGNICLLARKYIEIADFLLVTPS
jgi:predicted nucleotidyltransferase